jgi:hypothetical protein
LLNTVVTTNQHYCQVTDFATKMSKPTNKQVLEAFRNGTIDSVLILFSDSINMSACNKSWKSCVSRLVEQERKLRKSISRDVGRQNLCLFYDSVFEPPKHSASVFENANASILDESPPASSSNRRSSIVSRLHDSDMEYFRFESEKLATELSIARSKIESLQEDLTTLSNLLETVDEEREGLKNR